MPKPAKPISNEKEFRKALLHLKKLGLVTLDRGKPGDKDASGRWTRAMSVFAWLLLEHPGFIEQLAAKLEERRPYAS